MCGDIRSVLVGSVVLSILVGWTQQSSIPQHEDDSVRLTRGRDVLKYMNLSVDPCHDFYEYACGNWGKYHTPPKEHEVATVESYLAAKIDSDLQALLEEQVTLSDGTTGRRIKEFYKSCVTAEKNGPLQQAYFSEVIKGNGGFPAVPGSNWQLYQHNYNWQEVVAHLRYRFGMDILIGLEIEVNHLNMHENSIYLGEPSTLIPAELCSAEGTQRVDIREREYELIEKEVAENLKIWLTLKTAEASKLAAAIVTFEFELCTGMKMQEKGDDEAARWVQYARKTLVEFSRQFNDSIDFNLFVTTSFGTPIYKPVFLSADGYFKQLIKTVQEHNSTTIANYIMYRALAFLSFPQNEKTHKRTAHCLRVLKRYFPAVLGDMYQRKYAHTAVKTGVNTIYDKLKDSFHSSLNRAWIEEGTGRVGKKKLSELALALPTYDKVHLNNLHIDLANYWQNVGQVMAQVQPQQLSRVFSSGMPAPTDTVEAYELRFLYTATQKRISMGWGLLQAPFYEPKYPNAMLYATIGQRIATVLARAFDDQSWTSDFLGLSNWDRSTAKEYQNRTECFRRQLSNYLHNSPDSFRNATRLRQLIASSGGLNVAFNAYLNWLEYLKPNNDFAILSRETLPELNFTNTQLFFIAYAQLHCRAERLPAEKAKVAQHILSPLQRHTLERYEVNGPLRNFVEFARDFSCTAGADMHAADKCVIY